MNTRTARTLRRITGEGASSRSSDSDSPISPFSDGSFQHHEHIRGAASSQLSSFPLSPGSTTTSPSDSTWYGGNTRTFEIGKPVSAFYQPAATRPELTLLTDVGRRYPGFPTPLSPTLNAKDMFPSPASDVGSWAMSPRAMSPVVRSLSPMSLDGSDMCGPSRRCNSHGYEHYASQMGLIDTIIAESTTQCGLASPPPTPPLGSLSPTSPTSPRAAIQKNRFGSTLR